MIKDFFVTKTYGGYSLEYDLLKVSSGGIATALSKAIISHGGVVVGVKYTNDFYGAEYTAAVDESELVFLAGSKYVDTEEVINKGHETVGVYDYVIDCLLENKEVLFFGLGCNVAALLKICQQHSVCTDRLYCIELVCHGPTLKEVHKQYVYSLEKKYGAKITEFSVRYKKRKWAPPYLFARFDNGKQFLRPFYCTNYGIAFEKYAKPQCYFCHFKGDNHTGDLVIGDYWGLKKNMVGFNKKGVSIVFCKSKKGAELLNDLEKTGGFYFFDADTELALQNNKPYVECRKKTIDYDSFISSLNKNGLDYAINHMHLSRLGRIKLMIKKRMPSFLLDLFFSLKK